MLQLCSDLEEEGRQRDLVGAQVSLQLERREAALEGALELNHQLVTTLKQYKDLLEGEDILHSLLAPHTG